MRGEKTYSCVLSSELEDLRNLALRDGSRILVFGFFLGVSTRIEGATLMSAFNRYVVLDMSFYSMRCFFCGFSGGDSSLLFGEISGSALAGIEAALSRFLKPLLSESDGWGKADSEQKVILLVSLSVGVST